MVNATQMAKPFGKQPSDWTRQKSSKDFIDALCIARRIPRPSDLLKVTNGDNGGTWMHEDVAIEFARWLSPAFAIWCNDRYSKCKGKILPSARIACFNGCRVLLHPLGNVSLRHLGGVRNLTTREIRGYHCSEYRTQ